MTRYLLDRFEGDFAILEDEAGALHRVSRGLLPTAHEGDALEEADGHWRVDEARTRERREALRARMNRLRRKE